MNGKARVIVPAVVLAAGVGLVIYGYKPPSSAFGVSRGATFDPILTSLGLAVSITSSVFLLRAIRTLAAGILPAVDARGSGYHGAMRRLLSFNCFLAALLIAVSVASDLWLASRYPSEPRLVVQHSSPDASPGASTALEGLDTPTQRYQTTWRGRIGRQLVPREERSLRLRSRFLLYRS